MAAIREAGGYVSFDPNIRPDLWPDENELRRCLEQALQRRRGETFRRRAGLFNRRAQVEPVWLR
jgi:hypothetical protein